MKYFLILSIIISSAFHTNASQSLDLFFQKSDEFLKFWVNDGKVDYQAIQNRMEAIEDLYQSIGQISLKGRNKMEQKAFYLNAYNLIVVYQVSKYFPLTSPLDQEGFFDKAEHTIAGESMTLNHLATAKIMDTYRDPRIHFALACASDSSPKLASVAYLPQKLDMQLDQRICLAINDHSFIRIDTESKKILISSIFAWYKHDFECCGQSIRDFINVYRSQKLPADFSLDYYEYYWVLNTQEVVGR